MSVVDYHDFFIFFDFRFLPSNSSFFSYLLLIFYLFPYNIFDLFLYSLPLRSYILAPLSNILFNLSSFQFTSTLITSTHLYFHFHPPYYQTFSPFFLSHFTVKQFYISFRRHLIFFLCIFCCYIFPLLSSSIVFYSSRRHLAIPTATGKTSVLIIYIYISIADAKKRNADANSSFSVNSLADAKL